MTAHLTLPELLRDPQKDAVDNLLRERDFAATARKGPLSRWRRRRHGSGVDDLVDANWDIAEVEGVGEGKSEVQVCVS